TPFIPRPPIRNQDGQSHRNRLKGVKVGCRSPASRGQTCTPKHNGDVRVINTCRRGSIAGPSRSAEATAKVVEGSNGTKLKVTFAWPFEGDYWVLDRANDYSWSIVGDPSGRYLWLLTRSAKLSERQYAALVKRAASLGYDVGLLRRTKQ
ncbi:lipocalin family protein, partial [Bosea rubneri]